MNTPASLKAGLVIVASVIGTLVTADLILRAIGYLPKVSHEWLLSRNGDSRVPDENLILLRPRFLTEQFYVVEPALDTVVTLGDSFVEGYPVDDTDNYPSVLGRLLGERGHPVNILNMGLGDSGPDQHLRLMKEYLLTRLTPDIVVWSFYANDILDNVKQSVYDIENNSLVPLDASEHWLYVRHKSYRSIPLPVTVKENSPVLRLVFRALENWGKRGMLLPGPSEKAWSREKIRLAIAEMERLSQIHGFRLIYVLIAPQAVYLGEQDPTVWGQDFLITEYKQLRPIIARQERFVDAWFGETELHVCGSEFVAPVWSTVFADDGRDHNRLGSRHFNETGYYLLAEIVAACLRIDEI